MTHTRTHKGFTLVEILIVVVILGILAAIVIPQFTNASESAKAGSMVSQLQTIRSQLELAQFNHGGIYPDLSGGWTYMTTATDPFSTTAGAYTASDNDGDEVGPYLQQAPVNPFMRSSTVGAAAADGVGWVYSQSTGQITAVIPESANPTELGLNANDYAQIAAAEE
jgi:general secretion pathway protein G